MRKFRHGPTAPPRSSIDILRDAIKTLGLYTNVHSPLVKELREVMGKIGSYESMASSYQASLERFKDRPSFEGLLPRRCRRCAQHLAIVRMYRQTGGLLVVFGRCNTPGCNEHEETETVPL